MKGTGHAVADPIRVKQIVRNLLVNASRYGGESVRVSVLEKRDVAVVEVADDGSGISSEAAIRIFEPYERADRTASAAGSIGLGLTVSRTLARLMDGDLEYQRRDGWSIFVLSLPLDAVALDPA